jgi:hypothetical protein
VPDSKLLSDIRFNDLKNMAIASKRFVGILCDLKVFYVPDPSDFLGFGVQENLFR